MGLCICTCISCPISSCVGCGTVAAAGSIVPPSENSYEPIYRRHVWNNGPQLYKFVACAFGFSFLCLYLPLVTLCSRSGRGGSYHSPSWSIYPTDGDCWSEGSPKYPLLGLLTGAAMGVSFVWLIFIILNYLGSLLSSHDNARSSYALSETTCDNNRTYTGEMPLV